MQRRLAEIRAKLDRLRAADEERRVFGSRRLAGHGHEYREEPPLDVVAIACLELEYGAPFPDELLEFLRCVQSGGAGPGYGFELSGEPARAARPFPYTRADFAALMSRRREDRYASLPMIDSGAPDESWPPGCGFLPIAHLGCGVFDVLVVSGELRGTVWCCDMAWRPHTKNDAPSTFLDWYEAWLDAGLAPR